MNSSKNWGLKIDEVVYKELNKFPTKYSEKIVGVIESLSYDAYLGDIRKIKGEKNLWRRRIGSYRIFYEISKTKKTIHVFWVERRTSNTY